MSDRQVLAEFGAGLCLAGLAPWLATWAVPFVVPAAVLSAWVLDLRARCDQRLVRETTRSALQALRGAPDLTDTDLRAARAWLDHCRADLRLDPVKLAKADKAQTLPDVLYDLIVDDTLAQDGGARRAVRLVLEAAYQVARKTDDYHKVFTQEVLIDLARKHGLVEEKLDSIRQDTTALLAGQAEMQALLLQALQANQPRTFAAHTQMIIGLANNYSRNPDGTAITDFDTAYRGLENALRVAEEQRNKHPLPRNAADQVDAVLAKVQGLNDAAEFDRAEAALATARAEARERIAEQTSGLMRLLDRTIEQATLQNRPDMAAEALVERLLLDTPADPFAALRQLQDDWYVRGRDRGVAFDLEVSIALARISLDHSRAPEQRGAALNDLGVALQALGEREVGTDRLDQAVAAYRSALEDRPRSRMPLQWAKTQMNLGAALQTLGAPETGKDRLEQSVVAYRAALEEATRDRVPVGWAMAQGNLANVEIAFFDKIADPARLAAARAYVLAASEVLEAAGATQYLGMADNVLADIAAREA
ncbi:MAG: hypothetical protein MUE83_13910 [Tabrizicola sp.]|nr:hypothetical protein [Tabrizicola sp.]